MTGLSGMSHFFFHQQLQLFFLVPTFVSYLYVGVVHLRLEFCRRTVMKAKICWTRRIFDVFFTKVNHHFVPNGPISHEMSESISWMYLRWLFTDSTMGNHQLKLIKPTIWEILSYFFQAFFTCKIQGEADNEWKSIAKSLVGRGIFFWGWRISRDVHC